MILKERHVFAYPHTTQILTDVGINISGWKIFNFEPFKGDGPSFWFSTVGILLNPPCREVTRAWDTMPPLLWPSVKTYACLASQCMAFGGQNWLIIYVFTSFIIHKQSFCCGDEASVSNIHDLEDGQPFHCWPLASYSNILPVKSNPVITVISH